MSILKKHKISILYLLNLTTFIIGLTSCNNNNIVKDSFTSDEFIQKYDLYNKNYYGSLKDNNYCFTFTYLPFIDSNNKSEDTSHNDYQPIQIGTYEHKLENGQIIEGDFYASKATTPENLDKLIETIINDFDTKTQNKSSFKFNDSWDKLSSKEKYFTFEKDSTLYATTKFTNTTYYIKDSSYHNFVFLNDGYFLPNSQNTNFRTKNLNFYTDIKNIFELDQMFPTSRYNDDLEKTTFTYDVIPIGDGSTKNGPSATFYYDKMSPIIYNGVYLGKPSEIRYEFVNPGSNNDPYKAISSNKFNFLNVLMLVKGLDETPSVSFRFDLEASILKANGSIFDNNSETFSFSENINLSKNN